MRMRRGRQPARGHVGFKYATGSRTGCHHQHQAEVARWIHELVQKTSNGALGIFGMIGLIITASRCARH